MTEYKVMMKMNNKKWVEGKLPCRSEEPSPSFTDKAKACDYMMILERKWKEYTLGCMANAVDSLGDGRGSVDLDEVHRFVNKLPLFFGVSEREVGEWSIK